MKQTFISYSRKDKEFVDQMQAILLEAGFKTWIDSQNIRVGTAWNEEIVEQIKKSGALILVISSASAKSPYVQFEYGISQGAGLPVVPIQLETVKTLPHYLSRLQYLDFTRNYQWEKMVEHLETLKLKTVSIKPQIW